MIRETIRIVQADVPTIPLHQQVIVWAAKQNVDLAQPADNILSVSVCPGEVSG